jgi:hypothetical protein
MQSAVAGTDGTYRLVGLPAGSYFVAATLRTPAGDEAWRDPVLLDSLRNTATVVTLGDGQRQAVNLTVSAR